MTARDRVEASLAAIAGCGRPEVWTTLRDRDETLSEAAAVDLRAAAGEPLPLLGITVAVKDNVDVAGLPTTAACPAFAYDPVVDAPAVARLRAAGAIVVGKTNLDQFATGLVGTRSPYGVVRDARRPELVSGGSSSGSAVAVALGLADIGVGTDTAGSGRVPAAFQGVVGLKPTRGLVPVRGVVPACRTLDCVSVFAADLNGASRAAGVMAGRDPTDPLGRAWPADAPLAASARPRVAVPAGDALRPLTAAGREAFAAAAQRLRAAGAELVEVDVAVLLEAGRLLYEGAFVALRHAAVGDFVESHRGAVDPVVGAIIAGAARVPASRMGADGERLDRLALQARAALAGTDALLLPTAPRQPTIAEVAGDPVGTNRALGKYSTFCNLLDMAAVAVPAGHADGRNFGVTVFAPAFHDAVAADVAALLLGEDAAGHLRPPGVELLVVGAHRRGQPLHHELTRHGARFLAVVDTSSDYRLHRLDTDPPKPGLERVADGGVAVEGELWAVPPVGLADLLERLPPPMMLGPVRLADGRHVVGFLCEPVALDDARDISAHASWPTYLEASTTAGAER